MKLHILIKAERLKQGLKQSDLSEKTNIRQAAISEFENGKASLTSNNIDKILEVLNIKINL